MPSAGINKNENKSITDLGMIFKNSFIIEENKFSIEVHRLSKYSEIEIFSWLIDAKNLSFVNFFQSYKLIQILRLVIQWNLYLLSNLCSVLGR